MVLAERLHEAGAAAVIAVPGDKKARAGAKRRKYEVRQAGTKSLYPLVGGGIFLR